MPVSAYYKGKGDTVMNNMVKEYGPKKGKQVFYATANKKDATPGGTMKTTRMTRYGSAKKRTDVAAPARMK